MRRGPWVDGGCGGKVWKGRRLLRCCRRIRFPVRAQIKNPRATTTASLLLEAYAHAHEYKYAYSCRAPSTLVVHPSWSVTPGQMAPKTNREHVVGVPANRSSGGLWSAQNEPWACQRIQSCHIILSSFRPLWTMGSFRDRSYDELPSPFCVLIVEPLGFPIDDRVLQVQEHCCKRLNWIKARVDGCIK